jgi:putative hydrolase of the HAD superfamily
MQKIENIIFDLGGVLLDIDYNLTRTAFEKLGVEHFDDMYSQATADKLFQKLETGAITDENFYREFNRVTRLQLSPGEIRKAWNAMLLSFREESLNFLDKIREHYRLYLLSNTNNIHLVSFYEIYHQKEREKSFEQFFNKAFYSFQIGKRKPDQECYEWVLQNLQINAKNPLFIDDSKNNIEGAIKAGLQTIWLTPDKRIEYLDL